MDHTFVGIKNRSGAALSQKYDGKILSFDKDETKVVSAALAEFLSIRSRYISDGAKLGMQMLFEVVPLHEALKVAKEPENPSIRAAKAIALASEERTGEIRTQVLKALKEEGWTPPGGGAGAALSRKGKE